MFKKVGMDSSDVMMRGGCRSSGYLVNVGRVPPQLWGEEGDIPDLLKLVSIPCRSWKVEQQMVIMHEVLLAKKMAGSPQESGLSCWILI